MPPESSVGTTRDTQAFGGQYPHSDCSIGHSVLNLWMKDRHHVGPRTRAWVHWVSRQLANAQFPGGARWSAKDGPPASHLCSQAPRPRTAARRHLDCSLGEKGGHQAKGPCRSHGTAESSGPEYRVEVRAQDGQGGWSGGREAEGPGLDQPGHPHR